MYQNPTLFPAVSNRETWLQIVQIADDETGDLISLTDSSGNPLYQVYLEISPPRNNRGYYGAVPSPYYDECGEPIIFASLANYLSIVDTGTIQIQIPFTIMQTLRGGRTYDVFLRLEDVVDNDARQLLIGKLPVAFGGRGP
jgi:hypothetical protein